MDDKFIPRNLALKLENIGYNEKCFAYYNTLTNHLYYNSIPSNFRSEDIIQLPLYSEAFDWISMI